MLCTPLLKIQVEKEKKEKRKISEIPNKEKREMKSRTSKENVSKRGRKNTELKCEDQNLQKQYQSTLGFVPVTQASVGKYSTPRPPPQPQGA